jgi:ABC-type Na+ efflux pump permease subunit
MNPIRSSLRMARKDLKVLFKDRGQLAVLFVMPLLFALIFGGLASLGASDGGPGGEPELVINVYLVNEDQGPCGEQVETVLRGIRPLRMRSSRSADAADQLVADGKAPAAIIIPDDFSALLQANQPAAVRVIKDTARQEKARAVAGILNEALTELSVMAEVQHGIAAVFAKTGALAGAEPDVARATQAQWMGVIWTAVQ